MLGQTDLFFPQGIDYSVLGSLRICPNCENLLQSGHCNKCQFDIDDPRTVGYTSRKKVVSVLEKQEKPNVQVTETEVIVVFLSQQKKVYKLPYTLHSYESNKTGEKEVVVVNFRVDYSLVPKEDLKRIEEIDIRTRVLGYHYPEHYSGESFTLQ